MKYANIETWEIKWDFCKFSFMKKGFVYFFYVNLILNLLIFFYKNL